ncbi:MAG TPA: hypothetical protein VEJ63_23780, partial [Planctomycetota bacterium]|nr:hypothetical protein [Planctomycetota bacterium]
DLVQEKGERGADTPPLADVPFIRPHCGNSTGSIIQILPYVLSTFILTFRVTCMMSDTCSSPRAAKKVS